VARDPSRREGPCRLPSQRSCIAACKCELGKAGGRVSGGQGDPSELQTFVNTILAQGWTDAGAELDETTLQARAEPFGLDRLPADVLVITAGVDVADDRLEVTISGWNRANECLILGHVVIWGAVDDDTTWFELDELLKTRWAHPFGGRIGVDACVVDSGDNTDIVYNFCFPRLRRRVYAGKGLFGSRPAFTPSSGKIKGGGRLFLIGVDTLKATVFNKLSRGHGIRFSDSLEPVYYEQFMTSNLGVTYIDFGLNSVEEAWGQWVVPNVQAYRRAPSASSVANAAIPLWHLHDWVWHEQYPGQNSRGAKFDAYRDDLLKRCPQLGWLRDVADASKHRGLGRQTEVKGAEPHHVLSALYAATGVPFSELTFFLVLNDGSIQNMNAVLRNAVDFWLDELKAKNLPSPFA
jgi:hypothetical protein